MSLQNIRNDLIRAERKLRWWSAQKRIFLGLAGVLLGVWLFGLADIYLKFGPLGRWFCFVILISGIIALVVWNIRGLLHKMSSQAVAARIERTFPELDNHLINSIQFSDLPEGNDVWMRSYLKEGVQDWDKVDIRKMRDKGQFRRALASLSGICLLIAISAVIMGAPWHNAMARIVNPLSQRAASVFASILDVQPGNLSLRHGESVQLVLEAKGLSGQEVFLELWPEDDERSRVQLGRLSGGELDDFAYTLESVGSSFHYRFRAGDVSSERFLARVQSPLAMERIALRVYPPAYTGIPARESVLTDQTLRLPEGSRVEWDLTFSRAMKDGRILDHSEFEHTLRQQRDARRWSGSVQAGAETAGTWKIMARSEDLESFSQNLEVQVDADRPPQLQILFPSGKTRLNPGADPSISWDIRDDYGISKVQLQRIDPANPPGPGDAAEVLEEWTFEGETRSEKVLTPPAPRMNPGEAFAYRIVAWDNSNLDRGAQKTVSEPIVFEWRGTDEMEAEQQAQRGLVEENLERLIQLQRRNLTETRRLKSTLPQTSGQAWEDLASVQESIRKMTGNMIEDSRRPLGTLTVAARQLYEDTMVRAVERLQEVPNSGESRRAGLANQAERHQERILRLLASTVENLEKVEQSRQITELLSMIDRILDRQKKVHQATSDHAQAAGAIPTPLIDLQDRLAEEMGLFIGASRREADSVRINDEKFADLLVRIADLSVERELPTDMFRAAEFLEDNEAGNAIEPQVRVLKSLFEFHGWLSQWRMEVAREKERIVAEAMGVAVDKLEQVVNLQSQIVEGMRAIEQRRDDLSGEEFEAFMGELKELNTNVKESALQIAADLHIFPEFSAINDLVDDIYTIFEDVDQEPGSDMDEVVEYTVPKNEGLLTALEDALEAAEQGLLERKESEEMWLGDTPDDKRILTESFDEEEFPAIANTPLPSEIEDVIGDLLERQEELRDEAEGGAVNHMLADMLASDEIGEGNEANFSAQGKSGNEIPENTEQGGRSIVGRQGMSAGETAAGSGALSEGDEEIERRRTEDAAQSGHVDITNEDEVSAVATGGGKDAGTSDEYGMSDDVRRPDAPTAEGSAEGMQAMLRRATEELYAKASSMHVRTGAVDEAILEMRRAEDAIRDGRSMQQIAEHQRRAAAALRRSQVELSGAATAMPGSQQRQVVADDSRFSGSIEEAPSAYRDMVSEYYRSLAREN